MKIKKEHVFIGVLPFATGAAVWLVKLCHDKLLPRFVKKEEEAGTESSQQDIFEEEDLEQTFEEVPVTEEEADGEASACEACEGEAPAEEVPACEVCDGEASAQEASACEACEEEAPAEEVPAYEACAEEVSAEEVPTCEACAEEVSAEEASACEACEEETPAEEAEA
ncbi:MAG: hypothetical protein IJJ52_04105 [Lachnospiraceae bacterium]|nr:hypothetical protein [Lachnospiraceae bacterium]